MTAIWQQIKQHWIAIGVVAIVSVGVVALIILVVMFNGTGFDGYTQVTTTHTIGGPSAGTIVRTEVYQPGKTLWDWLQLAIIPVAIAFGVFGLNRLQHKRDQLFEVQLAEIELDVTLSHQRETALQAYIDSMSELLVVKRLRESQPEDEVRKIARVRTLTLLHRLDSWRKRNVLEFLQESGLIDKKSTIINLLGADLREADLRATILIGANLRGTLMQRADMRLDTLMETDLSHTGLDEARLDKAHLECANLSSARLIKASLCGAYLKEADLSDAELIEANLTKASLTEANLTGANLSRTNLTNADLTGAKLIKVNLTEANLTEAFLSRVDLTGAKVTLEQLNKAKTLIDAIMPDGTKHA